MNEIDTSRLLTDLQRIAAQAQGQAAAAAGTQTQPADFSAMLKQAVDKVNELQQNSAELSAAFERGDPQVNLVETMVAMQKAGVAFQAMVQVRNKLVSAYQEVMSMPV